MSACHDVATKTLSAASGCWEVTGGQCFGQTPWENDILSDERSIESIANAIESQQFNKKCHSNVSHFSNAIESQQFNKNVFSWTHSNAVRIWICQDTTVETRWVDASHSDRASWPSCLHLFFWLGSRRSIYCELRRSIANTLWWTYKKAMERSTMLLMGKSTISTGPFSIAFCMFTRG